MTAVVDRVLSPQQQFALDHARPADLARVKQWLTARDQVPTPAAIAGRLLATWEHAEALRMKRIMHRVCDEIYGSVDDPTGPRSARLVKACVEKFGYGPTWSELSRGMGWSYGQAQQIIHSLARVGWLRFTAEPRSLRPGPRATDPTWRPKPKPRKTTTKRRSTR